jgi:hypothetical protein
MYCTKIKSIKRIGIIDCYDITTPQYHNFFLDNGILSHNCGIVGATGSGKSYLGLSACEIYSKMFDIPFDPNIHVISSLKELLQLITAKDLDKKMRVGTPILFDEPQNEANSRAWQSEINQAFNALISTFRNQRLVVFFALPYLEMIDRQSRLLFHCEIKVDGFNKQTKITTARPRFLEWNKIKGDFYRKRLIVEQAVEGKKIRTITMLGNWHVPLASKEIIDVYEGKKKKFTDDLNNKLLSKIELKEKTDEGKNKADEFWKIKAIYDKYGEDYLQVLEEMPNLNPQTIQKYFGIIKKSLKLIKARERTAKEI